MIKSCVTIALVPEIKTGPWIYWNDLEASISKASALGFDAIELFTPSADALDVEKLKSLLERHHLDLGAVGTGAGKVIQELTLTDQNEQVRKKAIEFIKEMVKFGAQLGAPAIIGSMQGNVVSGTDRAIVMNWLSDSLNELGAYAEEQGTFLIYEPLNRYETNIVNTIEAGAELIDSLKTSNVKLLADLFHMNIEESNLEDSISKYINYIGHVHFADSNRRPIGFGHTEISKAMEALISGGYTGSVSAEAFPWPNPDAAAEQTIIAFNTFFRK
jgi:sugar phosphate isomerase/epimerase